MTDDEPLIQLRLPTNRDPHRHMRIWLPRFVDAGEWQRMFDLLEAMRPGLVAEAPDRPARASDSSGSGPQPTTTVVVSQPQPPKPGPRS